MQWSTKTDKNLLMLRKLKLDMRFSTVFRMYAKFNTLLVNFLKLTRFKRDKRLLAENVNWIDQARKIKIYLQEATEFIGKAGEEFRLSTEDALTVAYLWLEADRMDALNCSFLEDLNVGLLESEGKIEVTRGVSLNADNSIEEVSVYDCSWSLLWNHELGIKISLITEAHSFRTYEIKITSKKTRTRIQVSYPIEDSDIKDAIISAYVLESTAMHS